MLVVENLLGQMRRRDTPKFIQSPSLKRLLPRWPLAIYHIPDNIRWAKWPVVNFSLCHTCVAQIEQLAEVQLQNFWWFAFLNMQKKNLRILAFLSACFFSSLFVSLHYQPNMCHFNEDWRGELESSLPGGFEIISKSQKLRIAQIYQWKSLICVLLLLIVNSCDMYFWLMHLPNSIDLIVFWIIIFLWLIGLCLARYSNFTIIFCSLTF